MRFAVERSQTSCTTHAAGAEMEARLTKTLMPFISAKAVAARANTMRASCSCVVKVVEHSRCGARRKECILRGVEVWIRAQGSASCIGLMTD
eukprot:366000-Chlamydomonas_euryale.AAC.50